MSRLTRPAALTLIALLLATPFDARVEAQSCLRFEQQLKQDQNAMRRQQDSIGKNLQELEALEQQAKDALKNAAIGAAKVAFGKLGEALEARGKALRGLEDQINRNVMRGIGARNPEYIANVRKQLQAAISEYDSVKRQVDIGKVIKAGLEGDTIFSIANSVINLVAAGQSRVDADVRAVVDTPEFRALIPRTESAVDASDAVRGVLDHALGMTPLAPYANIAAFVVDQGYNAADFAAARAGILQRANLSDRDLEAVNALKAQIERTVANLQECRAEVKANEERQQQDNKNPEPPKEQPRQPQPKADPPKPPSNVGAIVGTTVGIAGAAVGGIYLADELAKISEPVLDCSSQESAAERAANSLFTSVNNFITCSSSPRNNCTSQENAVNNGIQSLLNAAGNICSCYGASAAAELTAADKAAVNDALRQLRGFGFNTGTIPSCFR